MFIFPSDQLMERNEKQKKNNTDVFDHLRETNEWIE